MLPVCGACAAEDEKVLRRAAGPCGSPPRRENSQNSRVIKRVWGGNYDYFRILAVFFLSSRMEDNLLYVIFARKTPNNIVES